MRGGHDLGGMHGLGPIDPEAESVEPIFHSEWESRAFALTLACGFLGQWNLDESRHARERQHPARYLDHSYYENWLSGLTTLLLEKGLITEQELESSQSQGRAERSIIDRRLTAQQVATTLGRGGPVSLETDSSPGYAAGERIRVRRRHTAYHTRVPGYLFGCTGTIREHHGYHIFPEDNARGNRHGEHLYSVCFRGVDVWGQHASRQEICVDIWEPDLERL